MVLHVSSPIDPRSETFLFLYAHIGLLSPLPTLRPSTSTRTISGWTFNPSGNKIRAVFDVGGESPSGDPNVWMGRKAGSYPSPCAGGARFRLHCNSSTSRGPRVSGGFRLSFADRPQLPSWRRRSTDAWSLSRTIPSSPGPFRSTCGVRRGSGSRRGVSEELRGGV